MHFDWANSGSAPCVWHEEVTLFGSAIGEDRIAAYVTIVSSGDRQQPAPLPAEATGRFRFMLEHIARPTAPVTASDR